MSQFDVSFRTEHGIKGEALFFKPLIQLMDDDLLDFFINLFFREAFRIIHMTFADFLQFFTQISLGRIQFSNFSSFPDHQAESQGEMTHRKGLRSLHHGTGCRLSDIDFKSFGWRTWSIDLGFHKTEMIAYNTS